MPTPSVDANPAGATSATAGALSGLIGSLAVHVLRSDSWEGTLAVLPGCLVLCGCAGMLLHVMRTWMTDARQAD